MAGQFCIGAQFQSLRAAASQKVSTQSWIGTVSSAWPTYARQPPLLNANCN